MVPGALYHSLFLYLSTEVMFGNERENHGAASFFIKVSNNLIKIYTHKKGVFTDTSITA
ncbi:unnamed protein product [Staurois parvus]|uniref:Uncharacterized protein n=1 Tax=Staurois parvus TaxID=386267 RepID=A0ABN9GF27_9NEOB|nr:unnamed protein product [Staurois parvus]